ncbi:MAG: hypothetical protein DA408_18895 [Bacteroidetes bacterium]|nr:MAG: hypothetical protein DA408_18895 [Bacteroidota bacterium]
MRRAITKKQSKASFILELVVLVLAVGGLMGFLLSTDLFDFPKPEGWVQKSILIGGVLVMGIVALGLHELGHLLAGLGQGFQFQLFVVGPLGIKREDDRIKVYLNKDLGAFGGMAATSPVTDDPANARKFARLILAGPLASVVFGGLLLGASLLVPTPFNILLFTGGAISLAVFLATTIPSQTGMFFTDRKRYQRLTTPGKDQEVELALLRIMGRYAQDNSYRNVALQDIETMAADDLPFIQFFGLFNLLAWQQEMRGTMDAATQEQYQALAPEMPKAMVAGLDKELERMRGEG